MKPGSADTPDPSVLALGAQSPVLLIAGRGELPELIAHVLGPWAVLVGLKGFVDPQLRERCAAIIPLGQFGAMVEAGKQAGAAQVLFIGGLDRPGADTLVLDDFTKQHLDLTALTQGDDAILRAISDLFAVGGLETVGTLDVAPELAMPEGPLTDLMPPIEATEDLARGLRVAQALGALDVGQAVVVQQGLVLAVEGVEGTDALIARAAGLARGGARPVLVKTAKPGQDMRLDVPTIGPETIRSLTIAGFAGAFVEAGRALLVDRVATVAAANAAGLFLMGVRG